MKRVGLLVLSVMSYSAYAQQFDVIVVGAGAGGLSTAWEAGRRGKRVAVVDMFSVFGGHAVMSEGLLSIVDTPLQRAKGIADSPEIAAKDFLSWGGDAEERWVRLYVEKSRDELYTWFTDLGVGFDALRHHAGNTVPRAHENRARGLGLVAPVFRDCLNYPNIQFFWNIEVTHLQQSDNRVIGVTGVDSRSRQSYSCGPPLLFWQPEASRATYRCSSPFGPPAVPFPAACSWVPA